MSALSPIIRNIEGGLLGFWCPGCNMSHVVRVSAPPPATNWAYNGDPHKPTFTPSILVQGKERLSREEVARVMGGEKIEPRPMVCHSFVTEGQIQFLSDCTHSLAGQTVPLPVWAGWE